MDKWSGKAGREAESGELESVMGWFEAKNEQAYFR
jgi:hypothetical protein